MAKFNLAVCGGTFDLLHAGHKSFINDVLNASEKVLLGITTDAYVQSFKNNLGVEDFQTRRFGVERYLSSIGANARVHVVEINNAYEPYLETSKDYDVIIITEQTKQAAEEINAKREQNGFFKLEVVVSAMKKAEDKGYISSTRIRNGEINREGRLYVNPQWQNKNLILPENLRSVLQKPWGKIINDIPQNIDGKKIIVVGDATAQRFNERKVGQFLSIVDFLIQREVKFNQVSDLSFTNQEVLHIKNPHGIVTTELFKAIESVFDSKAQKVILIDGEDDLAVLPVLLIAPLGYSIYYGQPGQGLVQVLVTEENKEKAYQLTQSFDKA